MSNGKAPYCPVSYSQEPSNPRGTAALRLPSIPLATDLPSLIRSVNIMRDILRTLTTSLTVNNYYVGNSIPAKQYGKKSYKMSDYDSDWYQVHIDTKEGNVFHKDKTTGIDREQKVNVDRINAVEFRNNARDNDQSFYWRYTKQLDEIDVERGNQPFEEDFFERVINCQLNLGTEIKPKGLVFQTSAKPADPSTIMIAVAVRISKKAADAAKAAAAASDATDKPFDPIIPIFEFGASTDKGKVTDTGTIDLGFVELGMGWTFGTFVGFPPHATYNISYGQTVGPTHPAISGGPTASSSSTTTFSGGFYPTPDINSGSPIGFFIDDVVSSSGGFPSGQVFGGSISPGGWTLDGKAVGYHLVNFQTAGGGFADFNYGALWTYEFDDVVVDITNDTDPLLPSILYFDASDNSVFLDVRNRVELNSFDSRISTGDGSNSDDFKLDKWNHILISGDIGGDGETWSVTMNGTPIRQSHYTGHPDMKKMALNGLEIGVPSIPGEEQWHNVAGPNQDLDYIGLRVWFGKPYVNVTDPKVIELFVTDEKKLKGPKEAEARFGKPDVFMTQGAKTFIKNKGTAGSFTAKGYVDGVAGEIINYTPYPRFVGLKDTSKPSAKNWP